MNRPTRITWGAVLVACLAGVAAGQTYHVQDLGSLGGLGDTEAFGLSRTGTTPVVVGFATRADHGQRGFRFDGSMHEITPLAPNTQTIAYGVDGQGRAVGVMYQLGLLATYAWRLDAGTLSVIGAFTPRCVNQSGDIAGFMPVTETQGLSGELKFDHAVVLPSGAGAPVDLGTMNGSHWSRAYAINDSGRIVGCSGRADDTGSRAVVWTNGIPADLGTSGGAEACAYAISNAGTVVGYWTRTGTPAVRAAAAWNLDAAGQVAQRIDLGALPVPPGAATWSYAYGVNTRGAIVGQSNGRAFLHEAGRMKELNQLTPPGWFIVAARAINDSDAIAAWGVNGVGEPRSLLLVRCDADFNRDGAAGLQDLFDFLAAYFANDPGADIDQSGAVGVQDIFDFLAVWFAAPC